MEMIRENVKDYIKKKIGQKILPLVNLAFAVYDLVAGEEEIIRMRHAIACMILALKGRSDEDMTISAKVLSKIMADEFEDKIVGQLILKGAKAAKRAVASVKSARSAPQQDKPADKPDAPEPDPANLSVDPQGKADHPAPTTPPAQPPSDVRGTLRQEGLDADKPYDVVTHSTPQQMSEAARLTHHGQQPPGDDKRTQGDPAVDSRIAPPTAATGQETVEIAPGVLRRRGKKDGKDSPSPSHEKDSPDAAADTDPDADLADTQRELSQRGNRNREVDSSEVDEIRRSRHARERKGGNEDVADSKVLAKNMKKEGRLREGAEDEAHHIIPGNEPQAAEVVAILGEKGIGINEGFNGVYLTRGDGENVTGSYKHEFTFAQHPEYFVLLKGLVKKTDSPEAIRGKIRVLGGFLAKGELPTYKEVIETWKKMP
jgi:hypothetical protein